MLDIVVASYHCMQFQGKLMIQAQENDEKFHFQHDLGTFCPNSGRQLFFPLKSLALLVTRYRSQLLYCTIPEKTDDPILRKLIDGRTDK